MNSDHVIMSIKIIHSKGDNKNKTPKVNHNSIQFNMLLERAEQKRDPNYKHTVTVHH
jgi:hypothetical protein